MGMMIREEEKMLVSEKYDSELCREGSYVKREM